MINYFEVLNISEKAEIEVIRSSYKALAKKYHPDNTELPQEVAEGKMTIINEAYRVLSDDAARAKHIRELHLHSDQERKKTETKERFEYCAKEEYEYYSESDGNVYYVVGGIILVSVICCIIYFVPDLLGHTLHNIQESIKEIIGTF